MKGKLSYLIIITLTLVISSCLPPPPSCSSPSGNMICFDGVTYPTTYSNITGIYSSCGSGGMHQLNASFSHTSGSGSSATSVSISDVRVMVVGSTSPQVGTYSYGSASGCTDPVGTKKFLVSPTNVTFGADFKIFAFDTTYTNTLVITNVNVDLVSGHVEGSVKNMMTSGDVRELKIYFEDLAL